MLHIYITQAVSVCSGHLDIKHALKNPESRDYRSMDFPLQKLIRHHLHKTGYKWHSKPVED